MKNFENKTVLITGGAAGIGKIMARMMLQRKANVVLWDINPEMLQKTVQELSSLGKVSSYIVDVSVKEQIKAAADKTKASSGTVHAIINNAGIVVGKYFHEHSESDIERSMLINALAPMYITQQFLPAMMAQNEGHVCNIASSAGLISNPRMSVYASSKWAAVGWSDSLRLEMQQMGKNIQVTSIMPYYINTGMFAGVKSRIPILEPEAVAAKIIRSMEKGKIMVSTPSWIYTLVRMGQGFLSVRAFDWVAEKVLGIYHTMDTFTGHQKK